MTLPAVSVAPSVVRRAAYTSLGVALLHIVFGAIVRISGSGMGCGENWPKCYGYWFPPFDRMDDVRMPPWVGAFMDGYF